MSDGYGVAPPAFRLPRETRLGAVHLQVADVSRSVAFYESVLGLRTLARGATEATLAAEGQDQPLVVLRQRPGTRPVPRSGLLGLYHFAILLPDRPSLGRFVAHLGGLGTPVGAADHAVSEALYLTDPDGLGVEVYADRPRASWRYDTSRELFMTTAPLDLRSLMAAGDGTAWTGMPAGTTIGHVHLHVGALDGAAAFYHAGLGFDKVVWSYPGALFLSAGGYHHHLGTNTWSTGPAAGDDDARLLWWDVVVPRGEQASAAARSLTRSGYLVSRIDGAWTAADPWGTRVRITADNQ